MIYTLTAPFLFSSEYRQTDFVVCPTFSEENTRRFPKEGDALLLAPGHPIGASSSLLAWGSIGEQRSTWHTILLCKV